MHEKSIKKNATYSFLKAFLTLIFPVITFPYASRILLPEGIGKVNFANSIVQYFAMIAGLGITAYATREAAKRKYNKTELDIFAKEIFLINIYSTIVAYLLFFIALVAIPQLNASYALLLICSGKIFFSLFSFDWLYTALEEFKYITIRSALFQLLSLIFLFTFVKDESDVIAYAIFGMFSSVGSNLINFFYSKRFINLKIKTTLNLTQHMKGIFIFFGMALITSIYTTLDITILGFLSTEKEIGYYSAATKLSHMILSLLTAATGVLLPRLTLYYQQQKYEIFQELVSKTISILLLIAIPIFLGFFLLVNPIISLFSGNQFLPAIPAMKVISPIIIIIPLASITGVQILPSLGKEKISMFSYSLGAITNLGFNLLFIPKFGALGATIGTVIAESVVLIFQILFFPKNLFSKEIIVNVLQSVIAALIMAVPIFFIQKYITNPFIVLITSFIIGFLLYALGLYIMRNKYFLMYTKYARNFFLPKNTKK